MSNVVYLADYVYPWREAFAADGASSTLQVYVNDRDGSIEVIQANDEGEVTRTTLAPMDAHVLRAALAVSAPKKASK